MVATVAQGGATPVSLDRRGWSRAMLGNSGAGTGDGPQGGRVQTAVAVGGDERVGAHEVSWQEFDGNAAVLERVTEEPEFVQKGLGWGWHSHRIRRATPGTRYTDSPMGGNEKREKHRPVPVSSLFLTKEETSWSLRAGHFNLGTGRP